MKSPVAILGGIACLAASIAYAQSTTAAPITTSVFIVGADIQPLVASVIGADVSATTYSITCPPGTDSSDCGMGPGITFTQHGTTGFAGTMSDPGFSISWSCNLQATTSAVCIESLGGEDANFVGVSTETLSRSDIEFNPLTITAGQDKLAAATATPTAASSGHSGASTGSSATARSTGGASTGQTASKTGSAATASSTSGASTTAAAVAWNWSMMAFLLTFTALSLVL